MASGQRDDVRLALELRTDGVGGDLCDGETVEELRDAGRSLLCSLGRSTEAECLRLDLGLPAPSLEGHLGFGGVPVEDLAARLAVEQRLSVDVPAPPGAPVLRQGDAGGATFRAGHIEGAHRRLFL